MKRSSGKRWAVLPEEATRDEKRFLAEQSIQRLDVALAEFVRALMKAPGEAGQVLAANA